MKTIIKSFRENNVQKTILRSIAVIVSFVLLSFTVAAQGYWKQLLINNSFNQIATALVENPSKKLPAEKSTENPSPANDGFNYFYETNETSLNIEPWMTDEGYWELVPYDFNTVNESGLSLKPWMVETDFFNAGRVQEAPLELQGWMTNNDLWNF